MNELFADAVDYRNYSLTEKVSLYADEVTTELDEMTKMTATEMKDRIIPAKYSVSIIAFLQDFKVVSDASHIYESIAMWLSKHYLSHSVLVVIKARAALPKEDRQVERGIASFVFRNLQLPTETIFDRWQHRYRRYRYQ